jgi:hypothetical protein
VICPGHEVVVVSLFRGGPIQEREHGSYVILVNNRPYMPDDAISCGHAHNAASVWRSGGAVMLAVRSGGPDKNNSPLTDIPICGEMKVGQTKASIEGKIMMSYNVSIPLRSRKPFLGLCPSLQSTGNLS